jgi:probable addiction module antidote protein
MAITLTPFDAANYLHNDDDRLALLEDAFEENDHNLILRVLDAVVRSRRAASAEAGDDSSRIALDWSLTEGDEPTLKTILAVIESLGFQLVPKAKKLPAP